MACFPVIRTGVASMPEETELKLSVRPEHAARIGNHPVVKKLRTGRGHTKHLVSTYFDTPDLLLRQRALSLRIRDVDARHVQTLKRMQPSDGAILKRDEWEKDVAGGDPDLEAFEDGEIRQFFRKSVPAETLRRLFATDVTRTIWNLRNGNAEVELALDVGEIRGANGARTPLCEAELELKAGDSRHLYDIALALNDRIDCTVGTLPKSERGYALYGDETLSAVKASPVALVRDMTVWQAFVAISRNCLAHLEANAPVACVARDPEGIHQSRVAIRRLRAAFKVFKAALPEEKRAFFSTDLRWLQKQLGDARDLDVFLAESLDPMRAHMAREKALTMLRERVEAARADAYARAAKALQSRRYGRLRLELERWFAEPPGADQMLARSVHWFAKRSIRKAHRKVLAAGDHLETMSDAELHALRIRGKQARYCVEFFSSLYPKRSPKRHAKVLAQLQDCLGALNDSVVANALLRRLERKGGALDPRAKAFVVGWFAARIHDERRNLTDVWTELTEIDAYWG